MGSPITLEVKLTVKTPLAITTGETLTSSESVIKENRLFVINFNEFLKKIKRERKLLFYRSMLQNISPQGLSGLHNFYKENIDEASSWYTVPIDTDALQELAKRVFWEVKTIFGTIEINSTGNTSYKRPYIPGSSLKGAIRTAILNYLLCRGIIDIKKLATTLQKEKKLNPGTLFERLDSNLRCNYKGINVKNPFSKDIMRFVKVSDLEPINDVGFKVFRAKRARSKKPIRVYTEALLQGASFKGEIALYPDIFVKYMEEMCPPKRGDVKLTKEFLVKALKEEYSKVVDWERRRGFLKEDLAIDDNPNAIFIKLGFGAGAVAKTLASLPPRLDLGSKQIKLKREPTTFFTIKNRPMGWCLLEVF